MTVIRLQVDSHLNFESQTILDLMKKYLIMSCLLQALLWTTLVDFGFKLWSCGEESIYQMTTAVDKNTFIRYSTPAICCRQLLTLPLPDH